MSDLAALRDHALKMAVATHTTACNRPRPHPWSASKPDPSCSGCVTPSDRDLWWQIADEIEDYLAPADDEGLFA